MFFIPLGIFLLFLAIAVNKRPTIKTTQFKCFYPLDTDIDCPMCKSHLANGAIVCGRCGAEISAQIVANPKKTTLPIIFSFLIGLAVSWLFIGGPDAEQTRLGAFVFVWLGVMFGWLVFVKKNNPVVKVICTRSSVTRR